MAAPRSDTREQARRGRGTSLGGGKVRTGNRMHGMKEEAQSRGRSKSRDRKSSRPAKREYTTPFDDKGRCHYHKNVQLASKKFNGGWKVLCNACPKCMEQRGDSGDEKSVLSARSVKSAKSVKSASKGGGGRQNANGEHDKNGCCILHPHIQVARKRVLGSGWKVVQICPTCNGGTSVGLDDDAMSVRSGKSNTSRKSTRSTKSRSGNKSSGKAQSGRYGAMPFDGDGFCCRHPSVQVAQKKMMGGFKIIHDVCPDCAEEDGVGAKSGRRERSRSKSRNRRGSKNDDSSSKKKKRIRVKNLRTEDENGKPGRYSGYVNDEHQPNGDGVMRYEDGTVYDGVWSDGSKVHGKTKRK